MSIDRLRDAARAVGETITEVPPLDLGARTKRAWMVPLAAAASVAVAVAAGTMIARGGGNGVSQVAASTSGPVAAPTFFADVTMDGIVVRTVADGKLTATVPEPSSLERFTFIQAAQDNRLFYAASDTDDCHPRFYQFTLDEDGQVSGLGVLPFAPPEGTRLNSLAVNGDGSELGYATISCDPGSDAGPGLVLTDTASGESRTWKSGDNIVTGLSLSADGSKAAFRVAPMVISKYKYIETSPMPMPSEAGSPPARLTVTATPQAAPDERPNEKLGERPDETGVPGRDAPPVVSFAVPSGGPDVLPPVISASPCGNPTVVVSKAPPPEQPVPVPTGTKSGVPTVVATGEHSEPPSPLPSELPSDIPPVPVPSATASDLPFKKKSAYGRAWTSCMESAEVWLLDTNAPDENFDQAAKITLSGPVGEVKGGILGVQLSPDGTRLIAGLGVFGMRSVGDKAKPVEGAALVAYGLDGKPIETLYQDSGKGGMLLMDLDGSGQSALVQRMNEIGLVDAYGYHALSTGGSAGGRDDLKQMVALIGPGSSF